MEVTRTQRILIKESDPCWEQIDTLSKKSKDIYNYANYIVRQEFFKTSKEKEEGLVKRVTIYTRDQLCHMLKDSDPYKALGSQCAQSTLKKLNDNWKSWKAAIYDYGEHPEKYTGKPRIPKYLGHKNCNREDGRFVLGIRSDQVYNEDGYVRFSWKPLKNLNGRFKTTRPERIFSARFVPRLPNYVFEIVYQVDIPDTEETSDDEKYRIAGIDLGINNLMTVATNCGVAPIVINGRPMKALNAYFNKNKAKIQSELKIKNDRHYSHRLEFLTKKRNRRVEDYMHKASRKFIDWCIDNKIEIVICGHNKGWKQEVNMGTQNNQNFVYIPHTTLIGQLKYKCENAGIIFKEVEESYTSGTSFLDGESPVEDNYNKSRRKERGLFISNNGEEINADVNGAYQIIRKAFPAAFEDDVVYERHPTIINL